MSAPVTNPPVELARYTAAGQVRIVRGQRILGVVRLCDVPGDDGNARRYVIERELETHAEIQALVADYLAEAERWDQIPATVCLLDTAPVS